MLDVCVLIPLVMKEHASICVREWVHIFICLFNCLCFAIKVNLSPPLRKRGFSL